MKDDQPSVSTIYCADAFDWRVIKETVAHRPEVTAGASVLPFPVVHRRRFIGKLIAQMLARSQDEAECHLELQMRRQAQVLERKGVSAALISRELNALEAAVRTELWRILLGSKDPA